MPRSSMKTMAENERDIAMRASKEGDASHGAPSSERLQITAVRNPNHLRQLGCPPRPLSSILRTGATLEAHPAYQFLVPRATG